MRKERESTTRTQELGENRRKREKKKETANCAKKTTAKVAVRDVDGEKRQGNSTKERKKNKKKMRENRTLLPTLGEWTFSRHLSKKGGGEGVGKEILKKTGCGRGLRKKNREVTKGCDIIPVEEAEALKVKKPQKGKLPAGLPRFTDHHCKGEKKKRGENSRGGSAHTKNGRKDGSSRKGRGAR